MVSLEKHESCVGVGRGVAASKSSFLSALQTSQVLLDLDEQTADVRTNAPDIFNAVVEMLSNEKFPLTRFNSFLLFISVHGGNMNRRKLFVYQKCLNYAAVMFSEPL